MSMEKFKEIIGEIGADIKAELGNRVTEAKEFFSEMGSEVGAELGRLGVQGQAEIAGALFNGSSYVPYGAGQQSPEAAEQAPVQEQQVDQGREM